MFRKSEEWESFLGEQIKTLRLRQNMRQEDLAARTGLGMATVTRLEGGKGSSLSTLIKVLQVLRQESWLEQLAPESSVSPIQVHRLGKVRQRARARTKKSGEADGL